MTQITLKPIRQQTTVTLLATLTDNGVKIDWSDLSVVKAYIYSESQRVVAGPCTVQVGGEDPTILRCVYDASKPQYLGAQKLVIYCEYEGQKNTYDKAAFVFVASTAATVDDGTTVGEDTTDVDITVEDVSSSILSGAIKAALDAAEFANETAESVQERADQDHTRAEEDHSTAASDHTRAAADHTVAAADHTQAAADHSLASADHLQAGLDHTQAAADHGVAVSDHGQAGQDHARAESDHDTAAADHTKAGQDHTRAESDHTQAAADHTLAGTDHSTAAADHTQAASDHTAAAADHTLAGTDHSTAAADHTQALADHQVMQGYDTRLTKAETDISQLGQKEELDVNPYPIPVNISQLPQHNGTLAEPDWYDIPRGRHIVIPFRAGDSVQLKPSLVSGSSSFAGEFYAWLTDSYTPPTTTSSVPYVSGTSRNFARINTVTEDTAPEGTAYLCLVIVDGSLNTATWDCKILSNTYVQQYVGKLSQLDTTDKSSIVGAVNENKLRIDANNQKLNVLDVSLYDTSVYSKSPYIIWSSSPGSLDVEWTNSSAKHFVIPVNAGDILMLECNHYSYYAWFTNAYTPPASTSDTVPTVPQTGRYAISADTPTKLIVPAGAAYLYLVDIDGNGDQIINKLSTIGSTINNIYGDIAGLEQNLLPYTQHQITNMTEHYYIPDSSASNPNWYINSSTRHIAIPCSEGDNFILQAYNTIGFHYIWLTSAYTPPTAAGGAVPSVNGMGRLWISAAASKIITAPSGAAYLLVVTVNGTPATTHAGVSYIGSQKLLLDQLRVGVNGLVGDIHSYSGEKIELNKRYGLLKVSGVTKFLNGEYPQGMAIYGGYMFRLYNGAGCEIYDISSGSPELIETTMLACASYDPHCNSAQFAPTVVSGDFPYLYIAACRNAIRECYVVSVAIDGSSELIQKITFPALDELPAAMAFNVIIGDDGYLYCSGTKNGKLYFAKFKCPPTTEAEVTLSASDLVLSAVEDGYDYDTYTYQGIIVYQGKLFFIYGGSYNERGILVYNAATFQKTSDIRMTGIVDVEFEDADIYNSELYLQVVDTCYYKLTFNP